MARKVEAPTAVTVRASVVGKSLEKTNMNSIAILEAVNTSYVPFNGQQILTAMAAGVAYVAMKPIVENLGMSWGTQQQKLMKQLDKFNCIHMNMVAADGKLRKLLCLPLKKLNGWLFSINPEKVRADIRDKLIQYQEECFSVLHDYWTKGHVVNPRKAKKALPGKITTEQQEAIKQLVMSRGQSLPKEKQAKAMITMWSSLKSHLDVRTKKSVRSSLQKHCHLQLEFHLKVNSSANKRRKPTSFLQKKRTALYGYGIMPIAHRHYSANCIRR